MKPSRDLEMTRGIVACSFLVSFVLSVALFARGPTPARALFSLILLLLIAGAWMLAGPLVRARRPYGWMVAVAMLNMVLVVPELGLRLGGFSYVSKIEFGSPRAEEFEFLVPDARLFWRLPAELEEVNSLGFHGPEVALPKPEGAFRVLYLGDSCTDFGFPRGYSAIADSLLKAGAPDRLLPEAVVLALGGYSSHQGLVLAEMYGRLFDPDMVVVSYGWNDHWLARGAVDSRKVIRSSRGGDLFNSLSHTSRLLQAFIKLSVFLRYSNSAGLLPEVRVSEEEYERNISAIVDIFEAESIPLVLVTAPTSHYKTGAPPFLVELGFAVHPDTVTALHRRYNNVVREIARRTSALLLDMEQEFEALDGVEHYFISDGIHATPVGLELIGSALADLILSTGIMPREHLQELSAHGS